MLSWTIHSNVFHLLKKKKRVSDVWLSFSIHYSWFYPLNVTAIGRQGREFWPQKPHDLGTERGVLGGVTMGTEKGHSSALGHVSRPQRLSGCGAVGQPGAGAMFSLCWWGSPGSGSPWPAAPSSSTCRLPGMVVRWGAVWVACICTLSHPPAAGTQWERWWGPGNLGEHPPSICLLSVGHSRPVGNCGPNHRSSGPHRPQMAQWCGWAHLIGWDLDLTSRKK